MTLTLSEAELAGTLIQSVLFGAYIVLFVACLYVLLAKRRPHRGNKLRRRQPVNRTLFTISMILFLLIASHWVVSIARLFPAFIYDVFSVGGSDAYLAFAGNPSYVAKTALYVAQMFVGDITMVYRLYIVWGRSWRVIIAPVITTSALLAAGVGAVYSFARIQRGVPIFTSTSGSWIVTVFATSLTTNIIVTSLITCRILSVNRGIRSYTPQSGSYTPRSLTKIITIVLESAGIYTVCLTITHVSYLTKAMFQFTALDVTSPAIGIAFSLIIVRVGLGWATEGQISTSVTSRAPANPQGITLTPMAAHVSRHIDTDGAIDDEEPHQVSKKNLSSDTYQLDLDSA
ncbi:hypothetical protein BJ138DRAFT_1112280 [Hygrophoropsis aurantiaca]|uniref:Uncharacterized protein n=1 Tax=Hygrophoropsis aurantiaca TaxID=72124 RepID=A0ACB8AHV0_9AGAM|nr:hypothetical protein BJ138DRAFT_1112280 [Hygrophoropsis aurantiaca]